jgi:hypothetical protein
MIGPQSIDELQSLQMVEWPRLRLHGPFTQKTKRATSCSLPYSHVLRRSTDSQNFSWVQFVHHKEALAQNFNCTSATKNNLKLLRE